MIPRRIELVRAKGSRHGGGSFLVDSFNGGGGGGERERAREFFLIAHSLRSPVPLSTFSPSCNPRSCRCTRVHGTLERRKGEEKSGEISKGTRGTASDECRNQLATMFSLRRRVYALPGETCSPLPPRRPATSPRVPARAGPLPPPRPLPDRRARRLSNPSPKPRLNPLYIQRVHTARLR